ncbi:MAG: long-chain fatty acid transporter [Deltaproteobacteria bacterium]|nr:MAG: long-chain fatty acid transporter [Deltaproteobacteria bacterium]
MKKWIGLIILMGMGVGSAYGAAVDTFGIGAKATALGGAFTAYADDVFAIYYNPGGLTQLEGPVFSAGIHVIDPTLKVDNFTVEADEITSPFGSTFNASAGPADFEDESDTLPVPHMGFAMPVGDRLAMGVALYAPFGLHIKWDQDLEKNPAALHYYESWYTRVAVTPTIAYKVSDNLSVGFGISFGRSEAGEERLLNYPGLPAGLFGDIAFGSHIKADLVDDLNYSANIGVFYKPFDHLSLGLTYRGRADTDFEGYLYVDGKKWKAADGRNTKLKLDYDHPDQLQVGLRYITIHNFSVETDVVWTHWSVGDEQNTSISPAFLGRKDRAIHNRDWHDTVQVRLGVEWAWDEMFTFRGGYFYDPSPIPDETFDMMWPDGDRKTYSLGVGVNLGKFVIDGILEYALSEGKREIGGETDNMNHSYNPYEPLGLDNDARVSLSAEGYLWACGLTVSYQF